MSELCCKRCGSVATRKELGAWGPHSQRIVCADCGSWIKWGHGDKSWKERAAEYVKRRASEGDADAQKLADDPGCPR